MQIYIFNFTIFTIIFKFFIFLPIHNFLHN